MENRNLDAHIRGQLLFPGTVQPARFGARIRGTGVGGAPGLLLTTDWVLTETADALCDPANRIGCVEFLNDLRRSPHVEIVPATREWFDAGWDLYGRRPDKDWSLTDCISFVVMQDCGVADALTGDHHFEQAGFRALLK